MFYMQRNLVTAIHEDRHREADAERLHGAARLSGGGSERRGRGVRDLFRVRHAAPAMRLSIQRSPARASTTISPPAA